MRVTACVVSYRTAAHIPGVLDSLAAQSHPDLHVVVVDNASGDGSAEAARAHGSAEVLALPANIGFAAAANVGLRHGSEQHDTQALLLLNPDVRLEPDHVAHLVHALRSHPHAGSVQGRLRRMADVTGTPVVRHGHQVIDTAGHVGHANRMFRNRGAGQPDDGRFDEPAEVFGVSGCCALYRRSALDDVALLDDDGHPEVFAEQLFAFFEDLDVDWRLRGRGWHSRYVPDAIGWHERGGEGARRSPLVRRLSYRNWFLLLLRNDDAAQLRQQAGSLVPTTLAKTADMALTAPSALAAVAGDMPTAVRQALRARRAILADRLIPTTQIADDWFGDFDHADWLRARARRSGLPALAGPRS